ncbi:MAG TPA: SCP2 sterol-binding domain-containing protein [Paenalcaligenes sp.]|nr:SCP2 sterol-binding domain-containing protein [Paenalcaligenes sp.]
MTMNTHTPTIPRPVGRLLSFLPTYPGSKLFVTGLNLLLVKHLPADVLQYLQGRHLRIEVIDAQIEFDYCWQGSSFKVHPAGQGTPDLCFKANAWVYMRMIQRTEDPDTLFFSRDLQIEGDTELGLLVKNALDAMDMHVLSPPVIVQDILKRLPRPF